ncbi:MAG: invasion associated locus B family protein [Paracoccaceae bacterium]|jgi:invasion protein IalB
MKNSYMRMMLIATLTGALPMTALSQSLPSQTDAIKAGTIYIDGIFGPWEKRCVKDNNAPDVCRIFQSLNDLLGTPVAEITMFHLPKGNKVVMAANIMTPLETLLTSELQIKIYGSAVKSYPYSWCNKVGCVARIGFTQKEFDTLKKGSVATVFLTAAANQSAPIALEISLIGFKKAQESILQIN